MARVVAAVAASAALLDGALACTVVAVGKDASATGHPLVSHTDDSGRATTDVRMVRVPRQKWPKGSTRKLYPWKLGYPRVVAPELSPEYAPVNGQKAFDPIGEIPQVEETYAYWDMDYGVQNEMGLSIGESTCTARTVGWPATPDRPYGYNHASIEDLTKIALERCATARCAVDLMGKIAVEQGFYSDDSGAPTNPDYSDSAEALAVGDAEELWVFNVITGRNNASAIWAAMRIPAGNVAVIANSLTVRKMNLTDPENFRYSPRVTELAEEMGWWSPEDAEPGTFDFLAAYGYTIEPEKAANPAAAQHLKTLLRFYSGRRMWRVFSLLSPDVGAKLDPNQGYLPTDRDPYPSSVPAPKGSVTPRMVMNILRDHYEGTPYDLTQGMAAGPFGTPNRGPVAPFGTVGQWERGISLHRTSFSHVAECNPEQGSVTWLGYDSPHGTAYLPFFGAAGEGAPEEFRSHEGYQSKFSFNTAWWAFNLVNAYSDLNFKLINGDVRKRAAAIEDEGEQLVAKCRSAAKGKPREEAAAELAKCGNEFVSAKVKEWWSFAWSLFGRYSRYGITENETETGQRMQVYPAWWLSSAEVGFTFWSAEGPFHGVPEVDGALAQTPAVPRANAAPVLLVAGTSALVGMLGFAFGMRRGIRVGKSAAEGAPYVYLAE